MADRGEDLALLHKLAKERPGSQGVVIVLLVCAGLMWILATVSSFLDLGRQSMVPSITPHLIVAAFLVSLAALWRALNYYVVGPLVRETQRLRADIEALRSKERGADPGSAPDRESI